MSSKFEPTVTITLYEYNELKVIKNDYADLIAKIEEIKEEKRCNRISELEFVVNISKLFSLWESAGIVGAENLTIKKGS